MQQGISHRKRVRSICLFITMSMFSFFSCTDDNGNNNERNDINEVGALSQNVIYPLNNPYSASKEELGRLLFWDPILSGDMDISCATCHHPDHGYADGIERSVGVGADGLARDRRGNTLIDRNSPTIVNTAFNGLEEDETYDPTEAPMFWDKRESGLEQQAMQPILNAEEMRGRRFTEDEILQEVVSRLQGIPEYVSLFNSAFGTPIIHADLIGAAIASFERSIISNNSRFDQYMRGDTDALTDFELEGLEEFLNVGCANCHSGPMFSDFELHTLGVPNNGIDDAGASGNYDFRTPSLRNIALTAPYMHNGRFDNLEDVLDFYEDISDGRNNAINDNINFRDVADDARDLNLGGGDIDEIVAFLRTLTDEDFDKEIPESVPSRLAVGGRID